MEERTAEVACPVEETERTPQPGGSSVRGHSLHRAGYVRCRRRGLLLQTKLEPKTLPLLSVIDFQPKASDLFLPL